MFVTLLMYGRFERTSAPLRKFLVGTTIASFGVFVVMWMIWAHRQNPRGGLVCGNCRSELVPRNEHYSATLVGEFNETIERISTGIDGMPLLRSPDPPPAQHVASAFRRKISELPRVP